MQQAGDSQTYIGLKDCGCLVMASVDSPDHKRETAKEIAKAIREGLNVQKLSTAFVRTMPWKCELHITPPTTRTML